MSMYMMMRRMSQDPDIAHHQLSQGVVRRVLRFAKPYRFLIAVFVALVVILAALAVAPPLLFKEIIDHGFLQRSAKA
jgi:ATP-binding cassette, subfamily B, bacterial